MKRKVKKMTGKQSKTNHTAGQGMVEFALVLPVLIVIIAGIIGFGHFFFAHTVIVSASREASRYGSVTGIGPGGVQRYRDCAGIVAAAVNIGSVVGVQAGDVTINYDSGPGTTSLGTCADGGVGPEVPLGSRVVVQINTQYRPVMPLLNLPNIPIDSLTARTILKDIPAGTVANLPTLTQPAATATQPGVPPTATLPPGVTPTNTAVPTMTLLPTKTSTPVATNTPWSSPTALPPTATFTATPINPTPNPCPQADGFEVLYSNIVFNLHGAEAGLNTLSRVDLSWPSSSPKARWESLQFGVTQNGSPVLIGNFTSALNPTIASICASGCTAPWSIADVTTRQIDSGETKAVDYSFSHNLPNGTYFVKFTFENGCHILFTETH